jgi:hypothetical protein
MIYNGIYYSEIICLVCKSITNWMISLHFLKDIMKKFGTVDTKSKVEMRYQLNQIAMKREYDL